MIGTYRLSAAQPRPTRMQSGRPERRKGRSLSTLPAITLPARATSSARALSSLPSLAALSALAVLVLLFGLPSRPAYAEGDEAEAAGNSERIEPGFHVTPERFEITPPGHVEPLYFIGLFAADAGVGPNSVTDFDGGYDITDARLAMGGRLEKGFGYFLQANLIQSTPLLDLILDWNGPAAGNGFGSGLRLAAGYFRTPFGGELLIGAPNLDFINRSQIVRALAPGRQVGLQIDQKLVGDAAVLHIGAFNGNGLNTNDDERLLYMMRLDGTIQCACGLGEATVTERANGLVAPAPETEWRYGLNVAYSEDDDARLGLGLRDRFEGKRLLSGADLRWTRDKLFLSAEAIYGRIAPRGPGGGRDVYGYQASLGWKITEMFQALIRYDALWAGSLVSDRDLAIASLVVTFSKYVSIQSELRVPVRGESPTPGGIVNLTFQF